MNGNYPPPELFQAVFLTVCFGCCALIFGLISRQLKGAGLFYPKYETEVEQTLFVCRS